MVKQLLLIAFELKGLNVNIGGLIIRFREVCCYNEKIKFRSKQISYECCHVNCFLFEVGEDIGCVILLEDGHVNFDIIRPNKLPGLKVRHDSNIKGKKN